MAKKFPKRAGRKWFDGKDEKEIQRKLEEAYSNVFSGDETLLYAGVSKSSLYRYLTSNPEFRNRLWRLRLSLNIAARKTIVNALPTNLKVAMWWLEHKDEEFRR